MATYIYNKHNYSHPRIQRAFLTWFAESRHRFTVPLRIARHTKRNIELEFEGGQSLISATLTSWEINVGFDWEGICLDLMISFEAIPELTSNGYVCSLCLPKARKVYPSRELLWRDHLFEPFLDWTNGTLVKAPWIGIYGSVDSYSSVKLLDSLPENKSSDMNQISESLIIPNPLHVSSDSRSLTGTGA